MLLGIPAEPSWRPCVSHSAQPHAVSTVSGVRRHMIDYCVPHRFVVSPTCAVPQRRRFRRIHWLGRRSASCGNTGLERDAYWGRSSICLLVTNIYQFSKSASCDKEKWPILECAVNRSHLQRSTHGRSAKSRWGLIRGRGMNDAHRLVWLLGMPAYLIVNLSQQTFTGEQ